MNPHSTNSDDRYSLYLTDQGVPKLAWFYQLSLRKQQRKQPNQNNRCILYKFGKHLKTLLRFLIKLTGLQCPPDQLHFTKNASTVEELSTQSFIMASISLHITHRNQLWMERLAATRRQMTFPPLKHVVLVCHE
ncbi:hypothetical protein DsansV1_C01g0007911 [Dioscorea sansibarensis]